MKKSMSFRLLSIGLMAGIGMSILSGCKEEKNIDYTIEGVTEESLTKDNGAKIGVSQFQNEVKWEEEWESPIVETGEIMVDVVVDAKITLPETEQMSVIEAIEPEFDAEYKEQIAKLLFENEDIYYGDVSHLTTKELGEMQDFFESGGTVSVPGGLLSK